MKPIILHHLSDIHVGPDHLEPLNRAVPFRVSGVQASRLQAYLNYIQFAKPKPDAIIISGDLTSRGTKEEFECAATLIARIADQISPRKSGARRRSGVKICVIPGNHDLDWSRDTFQEKIQNYQAAFEQFDRRVFALGISQTPYFIIEGTNILVYPFNTCLLGGYVNKAIHTVQQLISKAIGEKSDREEAHQALEQEKRLDPGYISNSDLSVIYHQLPPSHHRMFKVAVMHHNLSPLPTSHIDRFGCIINAGVAKQHLMAAGFDLVLHGHQHFPHCSYEEYIQDSALAERQVPSVHGLYILSAPSVGTKFADPTGPRWFQIRIDSEDTDRLTPSSLVRVYSAKSDPVRSYVIQQDPEYRFSIGKPLSGRLRLLHDYLDRDQKELPSQAEVLARAATEAVFMPLLRLKGSLDDWIPQKKAWQFEFHLDLVEYRQIFGTDMLGPSGWLNPSYQSYLYKQFAERLSRTQKSNVFSARVLDAIQRTNWGGKQAWEVFDPTIDNSLEIVRILVWSDAHLSDPLARSVLEMIDAMHSSFNIPVFMLDPEKSSLSDDELNQEFVCASRMSATKGLRSKAYVYDLRYPEKDTVLAVNPSIYIDRFHQMLESNALRSVQDALRG